MSWCITCMCERQKQARLAKRRAGLYWFQEASGGRKPLPYDFDHRFTNDEWRRLGDSYVKILKATVKYLIEVKKNRRAATVITTHLTTLPKHLPYTLHVSGAEWPIIATALIRVKQFGKPISKDAASLYYYLNSARKEAKSEYEKQS
jgi:hypothetical protein